MSSMQYTAQEVSGSTLIPRLSYSREDETTAIDLFVRWLYNDRCKLPKIKNDSSKLPVVEDDSLST